MSFSFDIELYNSIRISFFISFIWSFFPQCIFVGVSEVFDLLAVVHVGYDKLAVVAELDLQISLADVELMMLKE